ncbi:hypothetical protein ABZ892_23315 [Streptomyces sp. NPDC046924]|uniref:hypothetical protein n=1 Tax=Streptomyces sp. NPDC046924 TaxID=3155136 RepID=UPI0033FC84E6
MAWHKALRASGAGGFMRMRFEVEAEEEFEAACALLVDRLVRWAGEQGLPVDAFLAEAALEYRHRATVDGRLGWWEPRHVEELLLSWFPQQVTELPGEERGDAPGTLRTLLRSSTARTGRSRKRGRPAGRNTRKRRR